MGRAALLMAVLFLGGCQAGGGTVEATGADPGPATAEEAVEQLRESLLEGDFEAAAEVTVPGQAVLASMAEGAAPVEVAAALQDPDEAISANFWSGFAQGAGEALAGEVDISSAGTVNHRGVEFTLVSVTTEQGARQTMITREVGGHRVDIFASFAPVLAGRLGSPVELLLDSSAPQAGDVLAALQDVVPSLWVAVSELDLSPQATQEVLRLLELVTRVG